MALKCHLTLRILITSPSEKKNGSGGVTFTRAITHQKRLPQSGRSTQSAVDMYVSEICAEGIFVTFPW